MGFTSATALWSGLFSPNLTDDCQRSIPSGLFIALSRSLFNNELMLAAVLPIYCLYCTGGADL